jgi:pimeloyl-ACP methyl ester carboxylesterase
MKARRLLFVTLVLVGSLSSPARTETTATAESRFAQFESARVHYTNYGHGETAVLFVHGWSCDETVWQEQAAEIAKHARIITIDLPGHGQSDKPRLDYTMDFYARSIDAVLTDAKAKNAILVGHSNGVLVVRQFYRRYPDKVRGLVLVDGGLRPWGTKEQMEKFLAPFRGPDYAKAAGDFIDSMTQPMKASASRKRVRALMRRTPQYVAISEFDATLDPAIWPADEIRVPVLMILAKEPIWTADYEKFVRSFVPDLDYQLWDGVSHFLMLDKPLKFNSALLSFLKQEKLIGEVDSDAALRRPVGAARHP